MLVTIISDASHCSRTKCGGYGFWAVSARGRHGGSGSFKKTMRGSWSAESMAIVNAVFISLRLGIAAVGDRVLIQTDSQLSIDLFTGITKRRISDPDVRAAKDELAKLATANSITFEFRHVRGHTTVGDQRSKAQRHADERAKAGLRKARVAAATDRTAARVKT